MTKTSTSPQAHAARTLRDRISAVLMIVAAVGAIFAFFGSIQTTREASGDLQLAEMWRMYGFVVFAALFLLLAWRPRSLPGIWEVAFFHKAAVAATALFMRGDDSDTATVMVLADGGLAVLIAVAYVLARGHASWRSAGKFAG